MIQGKKITVYELNGNMLDNCYDKVNKLLGLELEFEISQDYGTSCYGLYKIAHQLHENLSKEEIENKLKDGEDQYVIPYLRLIGELPMLDILFQVDY